MDNSQQTLSYNDIRSLQLQAIRQRMPQHLERLTWSRDQVLEFQQKRLRELFAFAKENSPYYRDRLADIDPATATVGDLAQIRPTTKTEAMAEWDRIVTVPGLTRAIAEEHIRQLRDKELDNPYYKGELLFFATGGSSGQRGLFIWEPSLFIEGACATFRCQVADELRQPIPQPLRCAVLTAGEDLTHCLHASSPLFSINVDPDMEVKLIRASRPIGEVAKLMEDFQPTHIIGYSSVIEELSHETIAGRCDIHPARISTNSEPLFDEARHSIRRAWGVEINNSWGSVEMHVVGVENDQHFGMQLAEDICVIEAVDQSLQPVENPADAAKILVTQLVNRAYPLIRYVIDDAVTIVSPNPAVPGYRVLTEIRGRVDDWFVYGDKHIHPMLFRSILGQYEHISEYRVEQTEHGAIVQIMSDSGQFETDSIANRLRLALTKSDLIDAEVNVQIVEELPRHSETGKVRRFSPLTR